LLKNDLAPVKKYRGFRPYHRPDPRRRQEPMDKIAQELEIHSTIEEESFYPAAKTCVAGRAW
jgi:hypothetical protein